MRSSFPVAIGLSLVAACMSNTSGEITNPCTGPNCVGNGGPLDAGDAGDAGHAGDGGVDGGDAGADGGDAGPCASFNGIVNDFCRGGTTQQQQTLFLQANGCNGTLYFDSIPYCTGLLDAGNSFDGGCNEPAGTFPCTAPALPGTITCQNGPGTTCAIVICGPGHSFLADGGCSP